MNSENEPRSEETQATAEENKNPETGITASVPEPEQPQAPEEPPANSSVEPATVTPRFPRFDLFLAGLVLVLGFLLSSIAIQESTFWTHLASGRDLAANFSMLGTDPYNYTTEGVLWVHHSWLFDLLLFWLYQALGGPGLVVVKALVITAMTYVLLQTRLARGSLWIAVVVAALALVAMSQRLLFDPIFVSLLFFAITCHVLLMPVDETEDKRQRLKLWLLPVLLILWVNLDEWFILGPITVFLVLLGQSLQHFTTPAENEEQRKNRLGRLKTLGLVFVAGLAACLVNPFFAAAFTLPTELGYFLVQIFGDALPEHLVAGGKTLAEVEKYDPNFAVTIFPFWRSPVAEDYWRQAGRGPNIVGLAYVLLLLAGLASFLALLIGDSELKRRGILWPLFLVWVFFGALSLVSARFVVFFAVVAVPITVLNWQEFGLHLAQSGSRKRSGRTWSALGRFATLLLLLVCLILAWPGWLQSRIGTGSSFYRVHWDVEPDPALVAAAQDLSKLKDLKHYFNVSPALACYCAWENPEVKSFYDYRLALLRGKGEQLGQIRSSLKRQSEPIFDPQKTADPKANQKKLEEVFGLIKKRQELFQDYQITHLAFMGFMEGRDNLGIIKRLFVEPQRWTLEQTNGKVAVFRTWGKSPPPDLPKDGMGIDFARLAFGKENDRIVVPPPPGLPHVADLTEKWLFGEKKSSPKTDLAGFYIMCQETIIQQRKDQNALNQQLIQNPAFSVRMWPQWGINFALANAGTGSLAIPLSIQQGLGWSLIQPLDSYSPSLALLTVQAARKGIAENPNDPEAYRQLALAYLHLWRGVEENWSPGGGPFAMTPYQEIRVNQRATALDNLLKLKPDDFGVHWMLSDHYLNRFYLDLAYIHTDHAKKLLSTIKPGQMGGLGIDASNKIFDQLQQEVEGRHKLLEQQLQQRLNYFASRTQGLDPLKKVRIALSPPQILSPDLAALLDPKKYPEGLGLGLEAIKILLQVDVSGMPPAQQIPILQEKIRLLANMGKMQEIMELVSKYGNDEKMKEFWTGVTAQLAASIGDYALCEENLLKVEKDLEKVAAQYGPTPLPELLDKKIKYPGRFVAFLGLPGDAVGMFHPGQLLTSFGMRQMGQWHIQSNNHWGLNQIAEIRFLRGLMALEGGNANKARELFQSVEDLVSPEFSFPDRAILTNYLREIEAARKK